MRVTTVFRRLIGVTELFVEDVFFEEGAIVLPVRPRWRRPRCGECGAMMPGYDHARRRRWRHLNLGKHRMVLEYTPRRVNCTDCRGIRTDGVTRGALWRRAASCVASSRTEAAGS